MPGNNQQEDCFYFLYSTCTKGTTCPFRHQEGCKKNEVLCREWELTKMCSDLGCTGRHSLYHLDKKRSEIHCYWEIHGGCKKDHCPFKHTSVKSETKMAIDEGNKCQPTPKDSTQIKISEAAKKTSNTPLPNISEVTKRKVDAAQSNIPGTSTYKSTKRPLKENLDHSLRQYESKTDQIASNIVGLKKLKDSKHQTVDFEVKSFDQIMKEKKGKQLEALSTTPLNNSESNSPISTSFVSTTTGSLNIKTPQNSIGLSMPTADEHFLKERKNSNSTTLKKTAGNASSVGDKSPVKQATKTAELLNDSAESLLEYLDKELEEMNQLLS